MLSSLRLPPLFLLQLISLPSFSAAYSWVFDSAPRQCSNLSITITGNDGHPPYRVLVLPFGASPFANNTEVRRIVDHSFDDDSTSTSFPINYPENSQFVAVVSDSTGFGTGGTSVAAQVTMSGNSGCFNAAAEVAPLFVYNVFPRNQIVQCQATRIWWDNTTVHGTPNFLGVIPGGQSFAIPEASLTNIQSEGTGFSWNPSVRGGTTLIIVAGDNRGNGTGGSTFYVVGSNDDGSCLSKNSPSSTPGNPAGGSYPTSTNGSTPGGSSGGGTNVGAIVGGVIGAIVIVVVALLLLYHLRRREKSKKRANDRPVNLMSAEEDEDPENTAPPRETENELPEFYRPDPYLVSESETNTDVFSLSAGRRTPSRRISGTTTEMSQLGLGFTELSSITSSSRKGPPRQMRAVNIIQHEDAGPSGPPPPPDGEDAETIELPPAYTHLKPRNLLNVD
ncbi:hypothetical protein APHAL10511_005684 [Amanita phalloides]|nr:hypothetical protein APHAL10511_005684 [Amanita phalloides]